MSLEEPLGREEVGAGGCDRGGRGTIVNCELLEINAEKSKFFISVCI